MTAMQTKDLSPYSRPPAPLTGGARFIRGFKRIGLALGGLSLLLGLGTTITVAVTQQMNADRRFSQATCMAERSRRNSPIITRTYDPKRIDFEASGCPDGPLYLETMVGVLELAKQRPGPLEYAIEPMSYGLAITLSVAAFFYFSLWLLGWLCAGFTQD